MGSNYIRISHYPQDDALLDTCDELGLLAWEEIPIIDLVPDTPEMCIRDSFKATSSFLQPSTTSTDV